MATIDRLEADGRFPKRIRLEPTNRVAWLRREVMAYLRDLAKRRPPPEPKDHVP
jgi:predicted DNA-binding transcriptional regulator AlpA